jgi:hypothetical protein
VSCLFIPPRFLSLSLSLSLSLVVLGFKTTCLARQVLYHLSHATSSFCFDYLEMIGSHFTPGWPISSSSYLHFQHSWDDRYTPLCPAFISQDEFFCLVWIQTTIPLISTSQVARITSLSCRI